MRQKLHARVLPFKSCKFRETLIFLTNNTRFYEDLILRAACSLPVYR